MFRKLKEQHLEQSLFSPFLAVVYNLLLVYIVYTLMRVEYLLENYSYFAESVSEGHLWRLFFGGIVFDTPGIMYTNALYIVLLLFPFHWKECKVYHAVCRWLFVLINGLAVVINLADSVYFKYTLKRTTSSVFQEFASEDNLLSIFGVEVLRHWYLILMGALLIAMLWRCYFTPQIPIKKVSLWRYYPLLILYFVFAGILCVSGIRGGFLNHWYQYFIAFFVAFIACRAGGSTKGRIVSRVCALAALLLVVTAPIGGWRHRDIRPVALGNANEYTYRPTEVALVLNTPFAIIRTYGKSVFADPGYYPDKQALAAVFDPVHRPTHHGMLRKKNVVVFIVESYGREYIASLARTVLGDSYQGYTPFTDSLAAHSATFRYSFCNGRKSIDGMPSILSAIPMFIKPFVLTPQSMNKVGGLAACLAAEGYHTAFFHGARTGSMGFNGFANATGFQAYYGREDYNKDSRFGGDKDFDGYWAVWDEPFLQYYCAKMSEMKEPFATAVFTASSHHPYDIPAHYKSIYKEEELIIHKCIRYTDNALRRFFDSARKQPWFKNTLFVITSDHTNLCNHPEFASDIGGFCSPIIIYDAAGDIQPGMRDAIAQHTDIMPTILGHLGYDKPYLAYGCDLLQTPPAETWAVNYLNGVYQYCKYGYVLQFDGKKTVGLYALTDYLMRKNLVGKVAVQAQMEREVKAIIQSYMDRMLADQLLP